MDIREEQEQQEQEFMYNKLQFDQFIVEPESKKHLDDVFLRDLNLTCFNELDIFKAREIIELINDLEHWNLMEASKLFKPTLFNLVNTARSRNGFERNALITKKRYGYEDQKAIFTQKGTGLFDNIRKSTKRGQ